MNIEQKMRNLKVKGKLDLYRTCMVGVIIIMGVMAALLGTFMYGQVKQMTEVWSPSLAYVQDYDTLTSDYRIRQYGRLMATTEEEIARYETGLKELEGEIETTRKNFEGHITTEEEYAMYENIISNWAAYTQQSEAVLELCRANKREEAALRMVGEIYDIYQEFKNSFIELKLYEEEQLDKTKQMIGYAYVIMLVVVVAFVVFAIFLALKVGKIIVRLITEPVEQITEAARRMYQGDMSAGELITYDAEDELGIVAVSLRGAMKNLADYIEEISYNLREIAKGDLTKDSKEITEFLGDFASIKESFVYILKRFNSTLADIQSSSDQVALNAGEIANASHSLSEGATDQASAIEELTATVATVSSLAEENAKSSQKTYENIRISADRAEQEMEKMEELTEEMHRITEISKEIENIITAIEDIASQTNLLSLNASIEAARAGDAGKGFAVVADQIGKLASDSAQSAVNTRELIGKTLEEIEKGNAITASTSVAFEKVIDEMKDFASVAQHITENINNQAEALEQIEQGIDQISNVMQSTAAASQQNTAISTNLSEESQTLDELVKKFKLY